MALNIDRADQFVVSNSDNRAASRADAVLFLTPFLSLKQLNTSGNAVGHLLDLALTSCEVKCTEIVTAPLVRQDVWHASFTLSLRLTVAPSKTVENVCYRFSKWDHCDVYRYFERLKYSSVLCAVDEDRTIKLFTSVVKRHIHNYVPRDGAKERNYHFSFSMTYTT